MLLFSALPLPVGSAFTDVWGLLPKCPIRAKVLLLLSVFTFSLCHLFPSSSLFVSLSTTAFVPYEEPDQSVVGPQISLP